MELQKIENLITKNILLSGDINFNNISNEDLKKLIKKKIIKENYLKEDWQIDYAVERIFKLVLTKKNDIKTMIIKSKKESGQKVKLTLNSAKVVDVKRNLMGKIFITDKNLYFITTKISKLSDIPTHLGGAGFMTGGLLLGLVSNLVGESINQLTNQPKILKINDGVALNILAKHLDGSFKIEMSNILLVRINNKNNHFVFKTKNNNQWSYNFFVANYKDREKIKTIFQQNNIKFEPTKGFFKNLVELYKKN